MFTRFLIAVQAVYRFFLAIVTFFALPADFYQNGFTTDTSQMMIPAEYSCSFQDFNYGYSYANPFINVASESFMSVNPGLDLSNRELTLYDIITEYCISPGSFRVTDYCYYYGMTPIFTDPLVSWTGKSSNSESYCFNVLSVGVKAQPTSPSGMYIAYRTLLTMDKLGDDFGSQLTGEYEVLDAITICIVTGVPISSYTAWSDVVSAVTNVVAHLSWATPHSEMYVYVIVCITYLFFFWVIFTVIKNIL